MVVLKTFLSTVVVLTFVGLFNVVISTRLQVRNVCALALRAGSQAFLAPCFKACFHLKTETGGYLIYYHYREQLPAASAADKPDNSDCV